jgi:hypothetical protein
MGEAARANHGQELSSDLTLPITLALALRRLLFAASGLPTGKQGHDQPTHPRFSHPPR